ncbi:hypothetical protein [Roseibium alexandrii]|uniref:hypothetical protein n=1 Tax=Roseibium alexandrii TaxID=388408 RepID=UPI0037521441
METQAIEIEIRINPKLQPLRAAIQLAAQTGVIGVGVLADSPAMQWCGFIFLMLTFFGWGSIALHQDKGLSIADARKRLDALERREA